MVKCELIKPPIPITVVPPLLASINLERHPSMWFGVSLEPSLNYSKARSKLGDNLRRDSGLAPSASTARESRTTLAIDKTILSVKASLGLSRFESCDGSAPLSPTGITKESGSNGGMMPEEDGTEVTPTRFLGIMTDIPRSSFEDLTSPSKIEFSNRGSMLIGGKRANNETNESLRQPTKPSELRSIAVPATATLPVTNLPVSMCSVDNEILSQNVRSLYHDGTDQRSLDYRAKHDGAGEVLTDRVFPLRLSSQTDYTDNTKFYTAGEPIADGNSSYQMQDHQVGRLSRDKGYELAGGIEDWEDINSGDVDRYGFIVSQHVTTPNSSSPSLRVHSLETPRLQRVSTSLQIASETPRRMRSKLGRNPSLTSAARSVTSPLPIPKSNKCSERPPSLQGSYQSSTSRPGSRIRLAINRLPYNRDRKCLDEAADMLTLPPGLEDIEENEDGRLVDRVKKRERAREEKWRKMARQVKPNHNGGGMVFEFDTKSPKLISRTWKGIPDRWRATAWHAFLTASVKGRSEYSSDEVLINAFHELVNRSSPDDVQIDIDVPRTINSHIMFRKRYRGGQRLLFRVLHCLSIYFPATGYVQGMAALTATMLCYFDEEMTFVMLVRMWQVRGIARLYQSGFEGLIEALDELEKKWLSGDEVTTKLVSYTT